MSIDWDADDKYIWSYMFACCGEGTCGGMGQCDTYEEAYEEVRFWIETGSYDVRIHGPENEWEWEGRCG